MYIPKRYGESGNSGCPFCGKSAVAKNSEGVPVCTAHKQSSIGLLRCACKEILDVREGKFGAFALCPSCGPINLRKALEMNPQAITNNSTDSSNSSSNANKVSTTAVKKKSSPHPMIGQSVKQVSPYKDEYGKDVFIRSDDPRYEFR